MDKRVDSTAVARIVVGIFAFLLIMAVAIVLLNRRDHSGATGLAIEVVSKKSEESHIGAAKDCHLHHTTVVFATSDKRFVVPGIVFMGYRDASPDRPAYSGKWMLSQCDMLPVAGKAYQSDGWPTTQKRPELDASKYTGFCIMQLSKACFNTLGVGELEKSSEQLTPPEYEFSVESWVVGDPSAGTLIQ